LNNQIAIVDPSKDDRWDQFVMQHPFGWLCHLSGWKNLLENCFPHMRGHYLAIVNSGNDTIQAALPLFEVRSWITGSRLVSIPSATLFDPLVSSTQEMKILLDGAIELAGKLKINSLELRTFQTSGLISNERLGSSCFFKNHYLSLEKEPQELMKSFHRSCVRQRIDRALNSEVTVEYGHTEKELQVFYRLYLISRKRLNLPPQPYRFLKSLWDTFFSEKQLDLLLAKKSDLYIGGLILFKFKERVSAEFSVIDQTFYNLSPNHLLFWEAIKNSSQEGFKVFDFGRTSQYNKSLMDFKDRWGTTCIDLPIYFYPREFAQKYNGREKSLGYKIMQIACKRSPDFAFKSIGNFCYRHLS
jgi:hypothetical protein